jgi:hypothetical protein
VNFRLAAKRIEADLSTTEVGMDSGWPTDRPVHHNPPLSTDGLDPAAVGGSSPLNGTEPLGQKVVSDPLTPVPQRDLGGKMPHVQGPDVDTTVLKNFRETGI